ncbi:hypothetical protein V5O48_005728 [Marasmius crinis-equi]|uniref:Uncharacterized protein n=1 Tax=Marasmius crinis-equi TaxID=585013 RepID=A0ABR3FLZ8_9AGAR
MHSVLEVTDSEIRLLHASFTDFLRDQSRSGDFYIDSKHFESYTVTCVIRYLNKCMADLPKRPKHFFQYHEDSLPCLVWNRWHQFCEMVAAPTEELLSELADLDIDAMFGALLHAVIENPKEDGWYSPWKALVYRFLVITHWLEKHPVVAPYDHLLSRFRASTKGFHLSPAKTTRALDAVLKLFWTWRSWDPEYAGGATREDLRQIILHRQDQINRHTLGGSDSSHTGSGAGCQGCIQTPFLGPSQYSSSVLYVTTNHPFTILAPFFINHISSSLSSQAIAVLLAPGSNSKSLLSLSDPSPALLPVLSPVVPDILKYREEGWGLEDLLCQFLTWLKLFPEEHDADIKTLLTPIREWTLRTDGEYRDENRYRRYEELHSLLSELDGSQHGTDDWSFGESGDSDDSDSFSQEVTVEADKTSVLNLCKRGSSTEEGYHIRNLSERDQEI